MAEDAEPRLRLAAAIEQLQQAEARRVRLEAAKARSRDEYGELDKALHQAQRALAKAIAASPEPNRVAVFLGEAEPDDSNAVDVEKAKAMVQDAKAGIARMDAQFDTEREAVAAVDLDIQAAQVGLKDAIAEVVAGRMHLVKDGLEAAKRRVASLE
jgi:hypothetical protein